MESCSRNSSFRAGINGGISLSWGGTFFLLVSLGPVRCQGVSFAMDDAKEL